MGRRSILAAIGMAAALPLTGAVAGATSVAYIDGGNVWLSSLDGTQKKQLTTNGEWDEVAQSDNGRTVAVRRVGAVINQLNTLTVWEATGAEAFQGTLTKKGSGWGTYTFPLGLDMTGDGDLIVYGYQNFTYNFPVSSIEYGVAAITARQPTVLDAVGFSGRTWASTVGRRVIAAQGSQVVVQRPLPSAPFGDEYVAWLNATPGFDLGRTDVAANGRLAGLEMSASSDGQRTAGFIDLTRVNGIDDGNVGANDACTLRSQGFAANITISQDATRIAWNDDGGVWVAGAPVYPATGPLDPVSGAPFCVLSSPPVLIAAGATHPSIGGANVADMLPRPPGPTPPGAGTPNPKGPGGAPGPGGGPGANAPVKALALTLPAKRTVAALRAGMTVRVAAPAAGSVAVVATVPGRKLGLRGPAARRPAVVARGRAGTAAGRVVAVKLRLTALGRARSAQLKGARVTVRVTLGRRALTRTVLLR